MLDNMSSRGPDSAGFAIYNNNSKKFYKYSLCVDDKLIARNFEIDVKKKFKDVNIKSLSDHFILQTSSNPRIIIPFIKKFYESVLIVGYGKSIEIFKQVGNPKEIVKKFNLDSFSGSHGIGHTRIDRKSVV